MSVHSFIGVCSSKKPQESIALWFVSAHKEVDGAAKSEEILSNSVDAVLGQKEWSLLQTWYQIFLQIKLLTLPIPHLTAQSCTFKSIVRDGLFRLKQTKKCENMEFTALHMLIIQQELQSEQ
jgi:hypothetical protein